LEEYDFEVEYMKGEENVVADALSRVSIESLKNIPLQKHEILQIQTRSMTKNPDKNKNNNNKDIPVTNKITSAGQKVIVNNNNTIYNSIPYVKFIIKDNINNINDNEVLQARISIPKSSLNTRKSRKAIIREFNKLNSLSVNIDTIFTKIKIEKFIKLTNKTINNFTIIINARAIYITDTKEKIEIIKKYHDNPLTGGHSGIKRTLSKIKSKYDWKAMHKDIANYMKNCKKFIMNKKQRNTIENLIITDTPTKAFDIVQVDTIGPLPRTENDNVYALTAQCELTNFVIIIPIPNKEAITIAKALVEKVILIFGPMKSLKSDQGLEYCNNLIKNICSIFKIEKIISTAYHHETLGKIERNHREINAYLRHYMIQENDWDEWLPMYAFSYNTTPSPYHLYTPFKLLFGNKANLPEEMFTQKEPLYNSENYSEVTKFKLKIALKKAQQMINEEKQIEKLIYDKKVNPTKISINDQIYITNEARKKLDSFYKGPYIVKEILQDNNITIEDPITNKNTRIHKNRIKK
jgi:hypothetical protein